MHDYVKLHLPADKSCGLQNKSTCACVMQPIGILESLPRHQAPLVGKTEAQSYRLKQIFPAIMDMFVTASFCFPAIIHPSVTAYIQFPAATCCFFHQRVI